LDPDVACPGAVAPDVSLSYMIGNEGDPDGQFCAVRARAQLPAVVHESPERSSLTVWHLCAAGCRALVLLQLSITGQTLNQGYYALSFNRNVPLTQLESLSALVSEAIVDGSYNTATARTHMLSSHAACSAHRHSRTSLACVRPCRKTCTTSRAAAPTARRLPPPRLRTTTAMAELMTAR
jgi:hypothetical protein